MDLHVLAGGQVAVEAGVLEDDAEALAGFVLVGLRDRGRRAAMVPLVGRSSVVSILMVVVLPAPLGPRKAKISPSATSKETSLTAVKVAEGFDEVLDTDHGEMTSENNTERFSSVMSSCWTIRRRIRGAR